MSRGLRHSTGSIGGVSNITKHSEELGRLVEWKPGSSLISTYEMLEDPNVVALKNI